MLTSLLLTTALTLSPAHASEAWPDVSSPPRASASRDGAGDAALIIAIEDYDHAQDLPGAVANGRAWRRYLKDARGVRTIKVLENLRCTDADRKMMYETNTRKLIGV